MSDMLNYVLGNTSVVGESSEPKAASVNLSAAETQMKAELAAMGIVLAAQHELAKERSISV